MEAHVSQRSIASICSVEKPSKGTNKKQAAIRAMFPCIFMAEE
jgi:hypothetical protein